MTLQIKGIRRDDEYRLRARDDVRDPDGKPLGEFPYRRGRRGRLRAAVEHARKAFPDWAALPAKQRAVYLKEVRHRIFENLDAILETISTENGKPRA